MHSEKSVGTCKPISVDPLENILSTNFGSVAFPLFFAMYSPTHWRMAQLGFVHSKLFFIPPTPKHVKDSPPLIEIKLRQKLVNDLYMSDHRG